VTALLALDAVTYAYPGAGAPALRGVTLAVEPGEFVVLAGGSGSGKSTLLRAATGLVPHFHGGTFGGRLRCGGLDTRAHGPSELAAVAGALFQDPETQVVMSTVRSELAFPLENRGWGAAAVARGVEEAALALGIAPLLDRSTRDLSGGELQRVALGAALAGRPRLLLLDEPTSQLDPVAGDELLGVLRRVNEEWGTAVVLAEHRLERCLPAADRVVALEGGAVAFDGTPDAFASWAPPELQPPVTRLCALAGVPDRPATVKGARRALAGRIAALASQHPPISSARNGTAPAPIAADGQSDDDGAGTFAGHAAPADGITSRGREVAAAIFRRGAAPARPVAGGSREAAFDRGPARVRPVAGRGRGPAAAILRRGPAPAVALRRAWLEVRDGPAILRGVDLSVAAGEAVSLMGRNGAGKSTLLRLLAGVIEPTRGKATRSGRVALLLQNPGDYFIHDRVGDDFAGAGALADRHPRDLSGGERQRLALELVLTAGGPPVAVCLDEPTRGMDRAHGARLAARLRELAAGGVAVLVATHDAEFAAAWADRTILLGDGRPVADAPTAEVLGGGWYFATQTARVLGGAGGALDPESGAALLTGLGVVS
jgi:energy-coupling factor transport system ATP-binding protein